MKLNNLSPPKVGMYAWGGPDTIRLLETKYHHPQIDRKSFYDIYSKSYLKQCQEIFGITDAWISYSWGFKDESLHQKYIRSKLKNFHELGIRPYLYVQGWNLVSKDFGKQYLFSLDRFGRHQPYSKGRLFTCPNNTTFQKLFLERVSQACQEDAYGIFIDNIMPTLPTFKLFTNFWAGIACHCRYCKQEFFKTFGFPLPKWVNTPDLVKKYLEFRTSSSLKLLKKAKNIAKKHHKVFGVNWYDPLTHDPIGIYGYHPQKLYELVDYVLIENHALSDLTNQTNLNTMKLFANLPKKDIFQVSYNRGISFDGQPSPDQIAHNLQLAKDGKYHVCLKFSEYKTHKVWHTLQLDSFKTLKPVTIKYDFQIKNDKEHHANFIDRLILPALLYLAPPSIQVYFESRKVQAVASILRVESWLFRKPVRYK